MKVSCLVTMSSLGNTAPRLLVQAEEFRSGSHAGSVGACLSVWAGWRPWLFGTGGFSGLPPIEKLLGLASARWLPPKSCATWRSFARTSDALQANQAMQVPRRHVGAYMVSTNQRPILALMRPAVGRRGYSFSFSCLFQHWPRNCTVLLVLRLCGVRRATARRLRFHWWCSATVMLLRAVEWRQPRSI